MFFSSDVNATLVWYSLSSNLYLNWTWWMVKDSGWLVRSLSLQNSVLIRLKQNIACGLAQDNWLDLMVGSNQDRSLSAAKERSFGANRFSRLMTAQHVVVVDNHVIAVAYSCDRCCQPSKRNMATWPEIACTSDIVISLQLLLSLWNSVRSIIIFSVQRMIQKNALTSRLWC